MNLLDSLFGALCLLLLAAAVAVFGAWLDRFREADTAAWQLQTIADAAQDYVALRRAELLETLAVGEGEDLDVSDLKEAGVLAEGFPESTLWGQPVRVYLRRASDDADSARYETIVTVTLALNIPDAHGWDDSAASRGAFVRDKVMEAVRRLDAGAYIPAAGQRALLGLAATTLHAPAAGWDLDLAQHGITEAGEGSFGLASGLASDTDSLRADYLHRAAVEGHAELNTMATTLDLGGHTLANVTALQLTPIGENLLYFNGTLRDGDSVGDLCGEDGAEGLTFLDSEHGLYVCRDGALALVHDTANAVQVKSMDIVANGDTVAKPACATGLEPHIYATAVSTAEGETVSPIQAFQTWATDYDDTHWQVRHRLDTVNGGLLEPEGDWVRILAITTCVNPDMAY